MCLGIDHFGFILLKISFVHFLYLDIYFLHQVLSILCPFLSSSPSWTYDANVGTLMLSQRYLKLSFLVFLCNWMISITLSVSLLTHSSASTDLLLISSSVFFLKLQLLYFLVLMLALADISYLC